MFFHLPHLLLDPLHLPPHPISNCLSSSLSKPGKQQKIKIYKQTNKNKINKVKISKTKRAHTHTMEFVSCWSASYSWEWGLP